MVAPLRSLHAPLLAAMAVTGSGCIMVASVEVRSGSQLSSEGMAAVTPGASAVTVLDALGPPTAVLRVGEVATIPGFALRRLGSEQVSAELLIALIPASAGRGPLDVLYLYDARSARAKGSVSLAVGPGGGSSRRPRKVEVSTERLLVLVDGERRVVRWVGYQSHGRPPPEVADP